VPGGEEELRCVKKKSSFATQFLGNINYNALVAVKILAFGRVFHRSLRQALCLAVRNVPVRVKHQCPKIVSRQECLVEPLWYAIA
jgi:hypothetical protein